MNLCYKTHFNSFVYVLQVIAQFFSAFASETKHCYVAHAGSPSQVPRLEACATIASLYERFEWEFFTLEMDHAVDSLHATQSKGWLCQLIFPSSSFSDIQRPLIESHTVFHGHSLGLGLGLGLTSTSPRRSYLSSSNSSTSLVEAKPRYVDRKMLI